MINKQEWLLSQFCYLDKLWSRILKLANDWIVSWLLWQEQKGPIKIHVMWMVMNALFNHIYIFYFHISRSHFKIIQLSLHNIQSIHLHLQRSSVHHHMSNLIWFTSLFTFFLLSLHVKTYWEWAQSLLLWMWTKILNTGNITTVTPFQPVKLVA